VVGIIPNANFNIKEIVMEREDLFLVYTDGIPDARNSEGVSFGKEYLCKLLNDNSANAVEFLKTVGKRVHQFIGTADQFDDITLLAVKRGL
jgi:serine phosphatase RsbU (regulator of sigma subunit)